jgi:hypothetical protein
VPVLNYRFTPDHPDEGRPLRTRGERRRNLRRFRRRKAKRPDDRLWHREI